MPSFVTDVEDIRKRAAQKIEEGAVTNSYQGDVEQTISILNEALATEIVCVLRYMHHYFMATGVHAMAVRDEFKEHADAEREHADKIADRIQQLGGKPDFNPASLLERSASQYAEGKVCGHDQGRSDRRAYCDRGLPEDDSALREHDPTTRVMIERILQDEEEHASDLSDLLFIVDPRSGETEGEDPGTHPLDMHHDEQSRQQRGKQPKVQADGGRTDSQSGEGAESEGQKGSHHRSSIFRRRRGAVVARSSRRSLTCVAGRTAKAWAIWLAATRRCWKSRARKKAGPRGGGKGDRQEHGRRMQRRRRSVVGGSDGCCALFCQPTTGH